MPGAGAEGARPVWKGVGGVVYTETSFLTTCSLALALVHTRKFYLMTMTTTTRNTTTTTQVLQASLGQQQQQQQQQEQQQQQPAATSSAAGRYERHRSTCSHQQPPFIFSRHHRPCFTMLLKIPTPTFMGEDINHHRHVNASFPSSRPTVRIV